MGSSTTTTGGASSGTSEGIEQTVHVAVDQRKRKRMLSNRESARRSRMRKQKHLDGLASQAGDLKKENAQILRGLNVTAQLYARVEAENSVLRAQMAELTHRLQSLNDITDCISNTASATANIHDTIINNCLSFEDPVIPEQFFDHGDFNVMMMMMNNPWNSIPMNQPITASADQMY